MGKGRWKEGSLRGFLVLGDRVRLDLLDWKRRSPSDKHTHVEDGITYFRDHGYTFHGTRFWNAAGVGRHPRVLPPEIHAVTTACSSVTFLTRDTDKSLT